MRYRPWVPKEMAMLPSRLGGLGVPCSRTELMTMAATAVGKWAATSSQRELLIGDVLWGSLEHGPTFITTCWVNGSHPRLQKSLWLTGAEAVSIPAVHHLLQGDVEAVSSRSSIFSSRAEVIYNDDGSVTVDVRQAIDAGICNGPNPVFSASE